MFRTIFILVKNNKHSSKMVDKDLVFEVCLYKIIYFPDIA